MKPVQTSRSNVRLVAEGCDDLPAERIQIWPNDVKIGDPDVEPTPGFETVWELELGERRAIANGARVSLRVWGAHPPVSLSVGEPRAGDLVALVEKGHVDRAVGFWYASIAKLLAETGEFPDAPSVLELWHVALEETREADPRTDDLELDDRIREVHQTLEGRGFGPDSEEGSS